jgi:hypothetical protein
MTINHLVVAVLVLSTVRILGPEGDGLQVHLERANAYLVAMGNGPKNSCNILHDRSGSPVCFIGGPILGEMPLV